MPVMPPAVFAAYLDKLLQDKGGLDADTAEEIRKVLVAAKVRPPRPKALPEFLLERMRGARPPWSWMNLDDEEAEYLDQQLALFVEDHNRNMVSREEEIIPACWRLHPPLVQILPALFWNWHDAHRHPDASSGAAITFHDRHLWLFHERLPHYLGPGNRSCRQGQHQGLDPEALGQVDIAADPGKQPIGDVGSWRDTWFGTNA